jgi:hypothetical protein
MELIALDGHVTVPLAVSGVTVTVAILAVAAIAITRDQLNNSVRRTVTPISVTAIP